MNKRLTKREVLLNNGSGMHICGINYGYEYEFYSTGNTTFTLFSYGKKVCTLFIYKEEATVLDNHFLRKAGDFNVYLIKWNAWKFSPTTSRQTRAMLEEIEIQFGIYTSDWTENFTNLDINEIMRGEKS
nr:MAG TPA: hypothetical protein [Caudoviricetes sp.]